MEKELNSCFSKGHVGINTKQSVISLVIKKIQIKPLLDTNTHYSDDNNTNNDNNNKICWGCGKVGNLYIAGRIVKLMYSI